VGIIPILLPSNRLGNNALFIEDDWYYYLEIGERVWSHGYPTFDGITFTSGFHPFWQIIVSSWRSWRRRSCLLVRHRGSPMPSWSSISRS
jgi:hypothetical protein